MQNHASKAFRILEFNVGAKVISAYNYLVSPDAIPPRSVMTFRILMVFDTRRRFYGWAKTSILAD